ncbi:6-bladed beta-propeller [Algoriphagus sp. CAU 1675]|uniref:6-bladed beta-propeller n=1 Tax=Algoriphagus sp. CAU 1675 TaxID=3032597 RepID=UPI0023DBA178|nr:6-bladed beta-propeller [Algoriphagus sp. CAU 1675]MDF2159074.1 6-bladed beta-propeller [Algoriphagus sp. CAU 1675]
MRYFSVVLLFMLGCRMDSEILVPLEPELVVLKPEKVLDDFGDGVFFTRVAITADTERVYVANQNPATLFFLDKDFNLLRVIEDRGDGPGSILNPVQVESTEHGLMVEDRGNNRISIYHPITGEFLEQINLPEPVSIWRFFYDGNSILYFPLRGYKSDSNSVLKVNLKGEPLGKVGVWMPQNDNDFNRQSRLIQPFEDGKIMLLGINLPYLDIISEKGELLRRHRLDQFEPIKRALDSLENDFKKPGYERGEKEIKHILVDAQYTDEHLYLTFTDRVGLDRAKARHLLEFKFFEDSLIFQRMFRFETGSPDDNLHPFTFFVDRGANKIYTQGLITQNIYVFDFLFKN